MKLTPLRLSATFIITYEVYRLLERLEEMENMEKSRDTVITETKQVTKKNVQLSKDIEELRRQSGITFSAYIF